MSGIYSFLENKVSAAYNGSTWMLGVAYNGTLGAVTGLSTKAFHGIINIATNIWQSQQVQSTKETTVKTLLRAPHPELKDLDKQLALLSSENIAVQDVQKLHQTLDLLFQNDNQLLKQWAPDLVPEDLEACRSFFQMLNTIVQNPQFSDASANPLLGDQEEDRILQPLMLEDGKTRLNAFSSIIHKITAGHSGYLVRAKDPLVEHKGKVLSGIIFTGTYYLTGDIWTAGAASGLAGFVASDPSMAKDPSKAVKQGKALVFCNPLLVESRTHVRQLQKAIRENKPQEAAESAAALKPLIQEASQNQQDTFKSPLATREARHLNSLKSVLDSWDGNAPLPIEQLKKPVNDALVVLDKKYRAQRGPVEAVADTVRGLLPDAKAAVEEVIEQPLQQINQHVTDLKKILPNLAKDNINNLMGWNAEEAPNPPPAAPANPADPTAPPVPPAAAQPAGALPLADANSDDSFLIQFLGWAITNVAKLIGEKNAGKASEKSLTAVAGLIALSLNNAASLMDNSSEAHQMVKEKVTALIAAVNQSATNRDWKKLLRLLQDACSVFKGVKAYVGDFRLPIPGTGANLENEAAADAALAKNIATLDKAIANPEPEPENLNWKELAIEEKDRLVSNATSLLTMKYIYEKVCGLQPDNDKFYPELLRQATETETTSDGRKRKVLSEEKLKELFFAKLTKVNIFKRVFAELQYWLYASGVKFFTQKASTIYIEEIFNYIKNNSEDASFVRGMIINNLTRYLTILGGAYKTVANTDGATGLMSEMLMKELEKKESNLGFETEELYKEFAKIVLEKTNGTVFAWIIAKFLGNPEEIVRSVIDMSTGSLQDANGYTHALNVVIGDQLDLVWKLLQQASQPATEDDADEPAQEIAEGNDAERPQRPQQMSEAQKNQLSILVKNLFEILRKSKCSTVDELRNLMEGKLWSENVNQAVDGLFIQDIIEQTTCILATATQSLIQGKQLEKLTYTFAKLVNNTFEVAEDVTPKQMQEAEEKVAKRSEQILRFAINTAIKEKLDFSGKKQQDETNTFIEQLHTLSNKHFDAAGKSLQTLTAMDASSLDARNKINELIEAEKAYKEECQDINRQVKAATINADNRDEINKRNLHLAEQSRTFVEAIGQMKIDSRKLEDLQKAIPRLQKIQTLVNEMGRRLYDGKTYATEEDIDFAEGQMIEFSSLLIELKTVGVLNSGKISVINLLEYQFERYGKVLIAQRHALSVRLLQSELAQSNSLLELIAQERNVQIDHHLGQPGNQENMNLLRQKLIVVSSQAILPQLHQQLKAIEDAALSSQVDAAKAEFTRLLNMAVSEANQKILPGRDEHWDSSQMIYGIIRDTRLLEQDKIEDAKRAIQESATAARESLEALKTWEQANYKKLVYGNFSSGSATKWIQDGLSEMTSNLVYERVKERRKGILNLITREETYRYGILHHSFLIPYVQRMKKNKK